MSNEKAALYEKNMSVKYLVIVL